MSNNGYKSEKLLVNNLRINKLVYKDLFVWYD
jgi:hypothetical protein